MKWLLILSTILAASAFAQVSPEEAQRRLAEKAAQRAAATGPSAEQMAENERLRKIVIELRAEVDRLHQQTDYLATELAKAKAEAAKFQTVAAPAKAKANDIAVGISREECDAICTRLKCVWDVTRTESLVGGKEVVREKWDFRSGRFIYIIIENGVVTTIKY